MDTGDDLAHARLDAGLFTEVGDVFTSLSDDDACVFCGDEGTEGEGLLGRRRGRARVLDRVLWNGRTPNEHMVRKGARGGGGANSPSAITGEEKEGEGEEGVGEEGDEVGEEGEKEEKRVRAGEGWRRGLEEMVDGGREERMDDCARELSDSDSAGVRATHQST